MNDAGRIRRPLASLTRHAGALLTHRTAVPAAAATQRPPHCRAGGSRDPTANCTPARAGCAGPSSTITARVHARSRSAWPEGRCARCCICD